MCMLLETLRTTDAPPFQSVRASMIVLKLAPRLASGAVWRHSRPVVGLWGGVAALSPACVFVLWHAFPKWPCLVHVHSLYGLLCVAVVIRMQVYIATPSHENDSAYVYMCKRRHANHQGTCRTTHVDMCNSSIRHVGGGWGRREGMQVARTYTCIAGYSL